jgi:hypothetical protein
MKGQKWGQGFRRTISAMLAVQLFFVSVAFLGVPSYLLAVSSAQAWSTKGDFSNGTITSNVEISGNLDTDDASVTLGKNFDSGANMILLWDGASAPTGWSIDTSFDNRFIRGNSTYGGTGEATTGHNHNLTSYSIRPNEYYNYGGGGTQIQIAAKNHLHNTPETTIDPATKETPLYRDFRVIRYNSGTPKEIPAGAIAFFDNTLPIGWSAYDLASNRLLRGGSVAGITGGTDLHTHNLNIAAIYDNGGNQGDRNGSESNVAIANHYHPARTQLVYGSNMPSYTSIVLAKAESNVAVPKGIIAMFDGSLSQSWEKLSDTNGALNQRFLYADSTYGVKGGGAHRHAGSEATGYTVGYTQVTQMQFQSAVSPGNSHTLDYVTDSYSQTPAYKDVVIGKLTGLYGAPGTISNLKMDAGAIANWENISWNGATPLNTEIKFRARGANTEADLSTFPWGEYNTVSGVAIDAADSRWLEIGATLESLDGWAAPSLDDFLITYNLVDQTAPVVTLQGDNPVTLTVGDNYVEAGATTDDGSIVDITGNVDTDTAGTYVLRYNSTDAAGNTALEVIRTVKVIAMPVNGNANVITTSTNGGTIVGRTNSTVIEDISPEVLGAQTVVEDPKAVKGSADNTASVVGENKADISRGIQWYRFLIPLSLALGFIFLAFGWKRRKEED